MRAGGIRTHKPPMAILDPSETYVDPEGRLASEQSGGTRKTPLKPFNYHPASRGCQNRVVNELEGFEPSEIGQSVCLPSLSRFPTSLCIRCRLLALASRLGEEHETDVFALLALDETEGCQHTGDAIRVLTLQRLCAQGFVL